MSGLEVHLTVIQQKVKLFLPLSGMAFITLMMIMMQKLSAT
jgi:hypothetical protein